MTEYVIDYRGEEWSVGVFSVILSIGVWAALVLATLTTWRSLHTKPNRFG